LQIDDEPGISAALRVRLAAAGYDVVAAVDGPSGLAAAAAEAPDLILLDIMMPGMDGFEVCRRLRADATTAAIPVVFLSANLCEDAERRVLACGGTACVRKPYNAPDLLGTIEACLTQTAPPEGP
jgi:DNA-binding response OmpR family regulator